MKVAVLTGKRGGYDALRPMLLAMQEDEFFELGVIACDMHFREEHGMTIEDIRKDFDSETLLELPPEILYANRVGYLPDLAGQLAYWLTLKRPDLLVLLGDRGDALVAALLAVQAGIPIAHIQGGDSSGTTDDIMRDMITKSANLHFVSCYYSNNKVYSIGEESKRIFTVGDLHLDRLKDLKAGPRKDHVIVLLHPDISDSSITPLAAITRVLEGCKDEKMIVIYPCNDPGWEQIVEFIGSYRDPYFSTQKSIRGDRFAKLLATAKCIVGNSSAGIIEAPFLGTPTVNVGKRQVGRMRAITTLITDVGYDRDEIKKAVSDKTGHAYTPNTIYGDGTGGAQIIEILKRPEIQGLLKPKMEGY